jgi:hypothetical protein
MDIRHLAARAVASPTVATLLLGLSLAALAACSGPGDSNDSRLVVPRGKHERSHAAIVFYFEIGTFRKKKIGDFCVSFPGRGHQSSSVEAVLRIYVGAVVE